MYARPGRFRAVPLSRRARHRRLIDHGARLYPRDRTPGQTRLAWRALSVQHRARLSRRLFLELNDQRGQRKSSGRRSGGRQHPMALDAGHSGAAFGALVRRRPRLAEKAGVARWAQRDGQGGHGTLGPVPASAAAPPRWPRLCHHAVQPALGHQRGGLFRPAHLRGGQLGTSEALLASLSIGAGQPGRDRHRGAADRPARAPHADADRLGGVLPLARRHRSGLGNPRRVRHAACASHDPDRRELCSLVPRR